MATRASESSPPYHDEWQKPMRYRIVTYRQEEWVDGRLFVSCGCGSLMTWKQSYFKLTRQQVENIPAFVYFLRENF